MGRGASPLVSTFPAGEIGNKRVGRDGLQIRDVRGHVLLFVVLGRERGSATKRSVVADPRSAGIGSCMVARETAEGVLDLHVPLEQAPELERAEIYVPDSVVDLL